MATIDLFHHRTLTSAINQIQPVPSFLLDRLYRNTEQAFSEDIDVEIVVGGKKLAPFVTPIEEGIVVAKLGRSMKTVKVPRIRVKKNLTAPELLGQRPIGGNIYVAPGDIDMWREQKIGAELRDLQGQIRRTAEWMASQTLKGKITVNQENLAFEIDFGLPSAHKPSLTGTDRWSDNTNSKPPDDILDWKRLISAATGYTASFAVCGKNVPGYLLNNSTVQKLLDNRNLGVGQLQFENSNYVGRLVGVDIYSYEAMYTDASGVDQPFIPDDAFILVATDGPFRLHYGLIYDLDLQTASASSYFSKSWTEKDPSLLWLLAESRPLPVPHWPECIVYATTHNAA